MVGSLVSTLQHGWRWIGGASPAFRLTVVSASALVAALLQRIVIRQEAGGLIFKPTAIEVVGIAVLLLWTLITVVGTGFYRRWIFWRPSEPGERRITSLIATLVAVVMLVETFASISSVLVQMGTIEVTGYRPPETRRIGNTTVTFGYSDLNTDVYEATEALLAWNLLDSVPGLKVPETINWSKPRNRFADVWGGVLLLSFKCLAILPFVALIVQMTKPRTQRPAGADDARSVHL
jgi:hypothetical protein